MDTANIVFVLFSSALVFLMTLGLAFFYGGLGRRKNVINTMMMVVIPAVFQMMFSIITVSIATGAVTGRIKFAPLLIFSPIWLIFVYYPLAHMVWGGGLLARMGALDFAGGDVVHVSS